jgi:hypothetical protein
VFSVCFTQDISELLHYDIPHDILRTGPNKPQWGVCALWLTLLFTVMISRILISLLAQWPLFTVPSVRPTVVYSGLFEVKQINDQSRAPSISLVLVAGTGHKP